MVHIKNGHLFFRVLKIYFVFHTGSSLCQKFFKRTKVEDGSEILLDMVPNLTFDNVKDDNIFFLIRVNNKKVSIFTHESCT